MKRPWLLGTPDERMTRRYWRGCIGKVRYPSKKNADGKIRSMHAPGLNSHTCTMCGSWHIGHHGRRITIVLVEEGFVKEG